MKKQYIDSLYKKAIFYNSIFFVLKLVKFIIRFRRLPIPGSPIIYDYLFYYSFRDSINKSIFADKKLVKEIIRKYMPVIGEGNGEQIYKCRTSSGFVYNHEPRANFKVSFYNVLRKMETHYALIPRSLMHEDKLNLTEYEEIKFYIRKSSIFLIHTLKRGTNFRTFYDREGQLLNGFMWAPRINGKFTRVSPNDSPNSRPELRELQNKLYPLLNNLQFEFYRLDIYVRWNSMDILFGELTFHPGGGVEICSDVLLLKKLMFPE
jgi:hypothetical protein